MKFRAILFLGILLPVITLAQGSFKNLEVIRQLIKDKEYERAVAKASEILVSEENTEAYLLRAEAYHKLKNYKNGIADYRRLLELEDNADARFSLALAYLAARDSSEANRTVELNLKLHPDHLKSIVFSSMLASHRNEKELAIKILKDAYLKYHSPVILLARATEYRRQHKYKEALSDYEAVLSIRKSSAVYMSAAQCASSAGNYKKALEYYKEYLILNPNSSTALNNVGRELQRIGKFTDAEIYLKKAIDVSPGNVYPLAGQAMLAYMQGDIDKAFSIVDASLLLNSKSKICALIRGHLNTYEGDLTTAETDYKKVLNDPQQNKYAYNALTKVYIYRGEYARAVDFASDYIRKQRVPFPEIYNTRGFAYYKMGKNEEAVKDFLYAMELEENYQPVFRYMEKSSQPAKNYEHIQFFTPFSDVNNSKLGFFTDGKKDFDFKIRIISKDEVDTGKINLYESEKTVNPKYWLLKSVEKRNFKYMDMLVTDVTFQYTPSNKKSYLKLSYAGTETQTQTLIK